MTNAQQFHFRKMCDFVWFDQSIDQAQQYLLKTKKKKNRYFFISYFFKIPMEIKRILIFVMILLPGFLSSFKLPTAVIAKIRSIFINLFFVSRKILKMRQRFLVFFFDLFRNKTDRIHLLPTFSTHKCLLYEAMQTEIICVLYHDETKTKPFVFFFTKNSEQKIPIRLNKYIYFWKYQMRISLKIYLKQLNSKTLT